MIAAYRLPLRFDPEPLRREVADIGRRFDWVDHWGDGVAEPGTWGVIPLLSQTGAHEGLESIHFGRTPPKPTAVLEGAPDLRKVLDAFRTTVLRARLVRLGAGKQIGRHRDYGYYGGQRWSFERGFIRVHMPIDTDENVDWKLEDKRIDMRAGEAWYLNVCLPHSVDNRSTRDRVHLVLELEVNAWVRSLFPPATPWDRVRGIALRRLEEPLWTLVRPLWVAKRYIEARTRRRVGESSGR